MVGILANHQVACSCGWRDANRGGDNFNTDIVGAKNAGIDQVYFNPHNERVREPVTYVVKSLKELKEIL